jgi:hypothetical protein
MVLLLEAKALSLLTHSVHKTARQSFQACARALSGCTEHSLALHVLFNHAVCSGAVRQLPASTELKFRRTALFAVVVICYCYTDVGIKHTSETEAYIVEHAGCYCSSPYIHVTHHTLYYTD